MVAPLMYIYVFYWWQDTNNDDDDDKIKNRK